MLVVKKITKKPSPAVIRFRVSTKWWIALAAMGLIMLASGTYGARVLIKAHTWQIRGAIVQRVPTGQKVVALTFDDGPLPDTTLELLKILKRNNAKATFFQLGKNIAANPTLAAAVADSGNEIGNHSYNHKSMALMTASNVAKEIEDTDTQIRNSGYGGPILFRPPYGDKLLTLPAYLAKHDRTTVMWNINPDDHDPASLNVDKILTTVLANIQPGSIIVLHPEYKERQVSLKAVEPIIKTLQKLGYEFVTMSELLEYQ